MKRKKLVGALLTAGIILASGCSRIEESKDVSKSEQKQQQTDSQQGTEADTIDRTNQDNPEQADSNGISFHTYSWGEITISIPDSWEGKYRVEEGEEGFALMQTASYEKENESGLLCGFLPDRWHDT